MVTTVRLDADVDARLTELAKLTGRSKSYYLREAINNELPRLEWENNVLRTVAEVRSGKQRTWTTEEMERELGL